MPGVEGPGTGVKVPGTGVVVPGTGAEVPGTEGEVPGTGVKVPGTGIVVPGTGVGVPGTGVKVPGPWRTPRPTPLSASAARAFHCICLPRQGLGRQGAHTWQVWRSPLLSQEVC